MAIAERHSLPILTFDFEHFHATGPERSFRSLVLHEARHVESTKQR